MRANPNVCVQTDEIENQGEWTSVIVNGQYKELTEPQYTD
jgi:nitroimidazol reductase NimA-like FMN-containing flavoprotein (pyridoxamine 5'-phosphate oxidase superfamily)